MRLRVISTKHSSRRSSSLFVMPSARSLDNVSDIGFSPTNACRTSDVRSGSNSEVATGRRDVRDAINIGQVGTTATGPLSATRRALLRGFKMKEAGRSQLRSLRSFLRISLRSSAYSSTIRRASCVREGLLGFSGLEANLSFCGFIERSLRAA